MSGIFKDHRVLALLNVPYSFFVVALWAAASFPVLLLVAAISQSLATNEYDNETPIRSGKRESWFFSIIPKSEQWSCVSPELAYVVHAFVRSSHSSTQSHSSSKCTVVQALAYAAGGFGKRMDNKYTHICQIQCTHISPPRRVVEVCTRPLLHCSWHRRRLHPPPFAVAS